MGYLCIFDINIALLPLARLWINGLRLTMQIYRIKAQTIWHPTSFWKTYWQI